ncbi:MAG: hypothetical protein AB7L92_08315, partial [Alphaproteobacteria bacterium]
MTMRVSARTLLMVSLTSVSAGALLFGCSGVKRELDYWTNDREPQVVVGGRRTPVMNPQAVMMTPPAEQQQSAAPAAEPSKAAVQQLDKEISQEQRAPTYEESPYDYFDAKGNRVEPEQPKQAQGEGNFFTRLVDSFSPSSADQLRKQPRKPLTENSYPQESAPVVMEPAQSNDVQSLQPLQQSQSQPLPAQELQRVGQDESADYEQQPTEPVTYSNETAGDDVSTLPAVEVSEQRKESPNWFERMVSDVEDVFTTEDAPEQAEAAAGTSEAPVPAEPVFVEQVKPLSEQNQSFPQLSSVPQAPESFASARADKDAQMSELQQDQLTAQQERRDLYAEPSGQDAMVPMEEMPSDMVQAPADMQPEPQLVNAEGEVLLGHASDASQPKASSDLPPLEQPVAAEPTHDPAMVVAQSGEENNEWWEGWNLFSSKRYTEEQMKTEQETAPAPLQETPAASTQEVQQPVEQSQPSSQQQMPWEGRTAMAEPSNAKLPMGEVRPAEELFAEQPIAPQQ